MIEVPNNNKTPLILIASIIVFGIFLMIKDTLLKKNIPANNNLNKNINKNINDIMDDIEEDVVEIPSNERLKKIKVWPPELGKKSVELEKNLMKKNYYIVFDGSGSMEGNKMMTAKKALKEFLTVIPKEANIGMVVFDRNDISERVPLGSDRDVFLREVDNASPGGLTPLKDSMTIAYDKIKQQGLKQLGYGEYNLVVVTDGEASSGQDPKKLVDLILEESPVVIHTIGFKINERHSLNQKGRINYKSANDFNELKKGLESVLAELPEFDIKEF